MVWVRYPLFGSILKTRNIMSKFNTLKVIRYNDKQKIIKKNQDAIIKKMFPRLIGNLDIFELNIFKLSRKPYKNRA